MSSIDNRVVEMSFNNDRFQKNIGTTMGSLDNLKGKLNFDSSRRSAEDLQQSFDRFSLNGFVNAVRGAGSGFTALSAIGLTALATITNAAVEAGGRIIKALTFGPALGGLQEYETNLNSIQTVLANTASKGTKLTDVNAALEELNTYSDKTIYNFSEMARNIGTFTAAGVDLKTSVGAIKGIANLAALSGSDSNQASTAMYQLSQALSTGTVKLQDWNSVVNAGMGGEVFQTALKDTAKVHGVAVEDIIKKEGSFRDSLQKGWLTADILNETLSKFTGDLSAEQLKTMGYSKQQIAAILEMGQTATDAATKVKTATQLIGTLKESIGSGWSKTFQIVFGDFDEAKDLFTSINNVLGGVVSQSADTRNALLQGWKDLGGRTALIEGFWHVLNGGRQIIAYVKAAFRDLFPKKTAQDLFNMTVAFRDLAKRFADGTVSIGPTIRILKGFFAILSIGWQLVKAVALQLGKLFAKFKGGGRDVSDFVGGIAEWLVNLDAAIKKGDLFTQWFEKLGGYIRVGLDHLKAFGALVATIFSNLGLPDFGSKLSDVFAGLLTNGTSFEKVSGAFSSAWTVIKNIKDRLVEALGELLNSFLSLFDGVDQGPNVAGALSPLAEEFKTQFGKIKDTIFEVFGDGDFTSLFTVLSSGFLGGIILAIRKFFKHGLKLDLSGGLLDSISKSFDGLTGTLTTMQTSVKANTLLKIAIAVGLLTLSIIALANIDTEKLAKALGAIAVGMGELMAGMAVLGTIGSGLGLIKIPILAASMILLAGALLLLSYAVKSMADLSWDDLARGLAGVAVGLTLMTASMSVLGGISGGILRASFAMLPMAKGLRLMAEAVHAFAGMDWNTMARGMTGVAGGLLIITLSLRNMPPNIRANALGLVIIAAALKLLALALSSLGAIPWDVMGRGLSGMAVALGLITAALRLMPKNIFVQAAGLVLVAGAMNILASAIKSMGGMSWEEIGKGLATLAGALGILAGALRLMSGTLAGALALSAVVVALGLFLPILITLGALPWQVILTALGALAGIFVVLGVAGLLLSPLAPILLALSVSVAILGTGILALGAGLVLAGTGIGLLVAAAVGGTAVLVTVLRKIIAEIPGFMAAVAVGVIEMAKVIGDGAPEIVDAMVKIAVGLLDAVDELAPKIRTSIGVVIDTLLGVLKDNTPKIVQAGFDLLISLLNGIGDNIGAVVSSVTDIITEFLYNLGLAIPDIVQAGFDMLVAVLDGIANSLDENIQKVIDAGGRIVGALIDGFIGGIGGLVGKAKDAIMTFFGNIWQNVLDFFGIASPSKKMLWVGEMVMKGFIKGIDQNSADASKSVNEMKANVFDTMSTIIRDIPTIFDGMTEATPTITPVLDLSNVENGARKLDAMLASTVPLDPETSLNQARYISVRQRDLEQTKAEAVSAVIPNLSFEQNNYSPQALSTIDIYRRTRNQISMAKEALGI